MIYDDNKTSAARIRTELPLALLRLKLEEENTSAARCDAVGWTERDELAEKTRENDGLVRGTKRQREREREDATPAGMVVHPGIMAAAP